jgi:tetratricopeptide (TPR) repeat protein
MQRFEEAIKRSPASRVYYHTQRAQAANEAHDEAGARSAAAALRVLYPRHNRALFCAGLALVGFDAGEAASLLQESVRLWPTFEPAHQVLGNALRTMGDIEGSERELLCAIALNPHDVHAHNSLGVVLEERHCLDDARSAYANAIGVKPMWQSFANLGDLARKVEDWPTAEKCLRLALDMEPTQMDVRLLLAEVLEEQGRLVEAQQELDIVVGSAPRNVGAWRRVALLKAKLGLTEESQQAAQFGLELAPKDAELMKLGGASSAAER